MNLTDHIVYNAVYAFVLLFFVANLVSFSFTVLSAWKKLSPEQLKHIWDNTSGLQVCLFLSFTFSDDYKAALVQNKLPKATIYFFQSTFLAVLTFGTLAQQLEEALLTENMYHLVNYFIWGIITVVGIANGIIYARKLTTLAEEAQVAGTPDNL